MIKGVCWKLTIDLMETFTIKTVNTVDTRTGYNVLDKFFNNLVITVSTLLFRCMSNVSSL